MLPFGVRAPSSVPHVHRHLDETAYSFPSTSVRYSLLSASTDSTSKMACTHIQALLSPPSVPDAQQRTLNYLNTHLKTFESLQESEDFDHLVVESARRNEQLKSEVRDSTLGYRVAVV